MTEIDYDLVGYCVLCHKKIANFTDRGTFDGFTSDAKDIYFLLSNHSKMHSKLCTHCLDNLSDKDYPSIMESVTRGWHEELARNGVTKSESDRYMRTYKEVSILSVYEDSLIMGGATISLPNTFSAGTTIQSAQVNSNFTTIYNDYNGNITNANVASGAAIAASKISLSGIAQTVSFTGSAENWAQGTDIASATSTSIGAATGNYVHITGTTTITSFDTVQAGTWRAVEFTGILTLTYNATSLILPTSANITTAAGDTAIFVSEGSGNWRCLAYQRRDGTALNSSTQSGSVIQTVNTVVTSSSTASTALPIDNTIPQITEGNQFMSLAITPNSSSNHLLIIVQALYANGGNDNDGVALFQDSTANALAAVAGTTATNQPKSVSLVYYMSAGTTSSTTFKVRIGSNGGSTITFNGASGSGLFSTAACSSMTIQEIKA